MPWLEMVVVLGLVLLNGYFATAELAVISARPVRLEALARKGRRGGRLALALAREPGRMLSTVQIGITLVGISAGAFGAARAALRPMLVVPDTMRVLRALEALRQARG